MKKYLILIFVIGQITICKAQQFSFQMNFVDAVGNKDSLIFGYDSSAQDTLDSAFGEINIISLPINATLDVRISDELKKREDTYNPTNGSYHTKKQIVKNYCGSWFPVIAIDISTKHWPVTAKWDNLLFKDSCKNGSVLTSVHPGGWWDVGSESNLYRRTLNNGSPVTFTKNSTSFNNGSSYINNSNDTISVFWLTFADSTLLFLSIDKIDNTREQLKVFPNPASNLLTVSTNKTFGEINAVEFYNPFGQIVLLPTQLNNIDISELPSGLYFIKATNSRGLVLSTKFLKV